MKIWHVTSLTHLKCHNALDSSLNSQAQATWPSVARLDSPRARRLTPGRFAIHVVKLQIYYDKGCKIHGHYRINDIYHGIYTHIGIYCFIHNNPLIIGTNQNCCLGHWGDFVLPQGLAGLQRWFQWFKGKPTGKSTGKHMPQVFLPSKEVSCHVDSPIIEFLGQKGTQKILCLDF